MRYNSTAHETFVSPFSDLNKIYPERKNLTVNAGKIDVWSMLILERKREKRYTI